MGLIQQLEKWSAAHHAKWMDALRILLGGMLQVKGLLFAYHTSELMNLLQVNLGLKDAVVLAHIISFLHIFLGTFILIGFATRTCCLVMIPVVVGSIIFINNHFGANPSELILSVVVLFLLVFFLVEGSGRFSVTYYVNKSRASRRKITSHPEHQ